ncbi:helix-turn-helix domain-containing protein [Cyclobacterium sp. 1_MG-2023]|uniref:helix-turn-helix domain-containing protein n=1 Tax=Cyclobacterium sp. 1_MG-2023 TaxID=3062681 RepID=UPI0026E3655F|nr:helix-turn-helix domain-containing protein [Cyclobacterium sp. 1_MG-2023]MDO6439418.1 helix-turn-helix domain-containing protein [Cyclobacterium sp. 1_MG-2023]
MAIERHLLKGVLNQYIEAIFHLKDFIPDHSIERVVPTGHVFIIFELDGFQRNTYDNDTLAPIATYKDVWVSGMQKNHISISAHQHSELFVIQFKAFGAYPFFHFPMQNLNDKVISGKEVFGEDILALRKEILEKKSTEEKFQSAEIWLLERFRKDKTPPAELLKVLERLQHEPVVNFPEVIEGYAKTQKHLIDQFKKYVGLTPKYYQRMLRFNVILQQIYQSKKIEWAQVAYQFEYTDQSHFIKEFKHFSGINPQKFIQQGFHDATNFFPLDKKG